METKHEKSFFTSFLKNSTITIGWLQIVASPLFVSVILGFILYLSKPGIIGKTACISSILIGLFFGIKWANKIHKQKGTVEFLSRNISTPELDKESES
jgi:hypothetical protein